MLKELGADHIAQGIEQDLQVEGMACWFNQRRLPVEPSPPEAESEPQDESEPCTPTPCPAPEFQNPTVLWPLWFVMRVRRTFLPFRRPLSERIAAASSQDPTVRVNWKQVCSIRRSEQLSNGNRSTARLLEINSEGSVYFLFLRGPGSDSSDPWCILVRANYSC